MNGDAPAFMKYFRLRPTRAAKVSEISEATASSTTPPEERVNFHIGNPVQEKRLSSAYLRAAVGLDIRDESLSDDDPPGLLRALDWTEDRLAAIEFYGNLVRRSAPYLPRGGFPRNAPSPLIAAFSDWLTHQQDPLTYDQGTTSGQREIILSSGGVTESLRVFFHALSAYLAHTPARIFLFRAPLPAHVRSFDRLHFVTLPDDEPAALALLRSELGVRPDGPAFLLLGSLIGEETRRSLRTLAIGSPLFILEANDAPNHLSLARESRLVDRVIRFLTPGIFSPRLKDLSLVFVAGNADYLGLMETLHFQLKGTPSASEAEFLTYLLGRPATTEGSIPHVRPLAIEPPLEGEGFLPAGERFLARQGKRAETLASRLLDAHEAIIGPATASLSSRARRIASAAHDVASLRPVDRLGTLDAAALLDACAQGTNDELLSADLRDSFLWAFVRHHPEYHVSACTVVSGSSRTALSLLGFHCGIREVIIPDLSWTYEHCFPSVRVVPLTPEFGIDTDAMIAMADMRRQEDPAWPTYGAVVLNNPHNATGRIFDIGEIRRLLRALLERNVTVIDDLSYQNVAPVDALPEIPTIRQIAEELLAEGHISALQAARVITVHSLSKTDCLAGARLSVIEIRQEEMRARFRTLNATIRQNTAAILLAYLFYRNALEVARAYWRLRNAIFQERMQAIASALENLPPDRNPFRISILAPTGSMYPLMLMGSLPAGLSLDWVAAGLARHGIGMVPLSTFARTEEGFETGRKAFRLTLGGTDGAPILLKKTRRVLIDLNRLIAEESAQYSRRVFPVTRRTQIADRFFSAWDRLERDVTGRVLARARTSQAPLREELSRERVIKVLTDEFLPSRFAVFRQRGADRTDLVHALSDAARGDNGKALLHTLEAELYKDDMRRREEAFRRRLFDRTVHPTQMFSIRAEGAFNTILDTLLRDQFPEDAARAHLARELLDEFCGLNVAISSGDEADEVLLDLDAHIAAELYAELERAGLPKTFLSFWGDWDGSNRPSGQGHRLVASVLLKNVERLSRLLQLLVRRDSAVTVSPELLAEIERLPARARGFVGVLNEITTLTHQLERRYRGILPFQTNPGTLRRLGMTLHIARDPVTSLWRHNDRLERRMQELRVRRRNALEYYFSINKRLRKELRLLLPALQRNVADPVLLGEAVMYRDLLQRFLITPRIHQNMVTAQDSFAIETTAFNINEINEIGARYGNPGMVLALQVSMSTRPEALIELERKLGARREHVLRDHPGIDLPSLRVIPLFEDRDAVQGLVPYLNKLWEYALQSRRIDQEPVDRFAEFVDELFIAGSDLSQQMSQAAGAHLFRQAKHDLMHWLAEHGLARRVRLKLGSGEPMQRQGGYYGEFSGTPAFTRSPAASALYRGALRASARRSAVYATTPMLGVFSGGDLRTLQSAIAERVRHLPTGDLAQLLYHLFVTQNTHRRDLRRASEELADSRLTSTARGKQALERLTIGTRDRALDEFLGMLTENFRQILYGRDEDVVGIHVISYFIGRTTPPLRDRPTVRPGAGGKEQGNKILERIAGTIPFSRYGSLLRAIAHNQAQTTVLGINQLTTGLFRALDRFSSQESVDGDPETFLADRILPHLPVYEILQSLRLYHDTDARYLNAVERAFPAGNSALLALREDIDAMAGYIPLFQQELVRRHGIDVGDFFEGTRFHPALLPTLRPDLAVLLQADLFNTDPGSFHGLAGGRDASAWNRDIERLLAAPRDIRYWREQSWALLERPVFQRVQSFVELAVSLYSISSRGFSPEGIPGTRKLPPNLGNFFRLSPADDGMRQFLAAAIEYLTMASEGQVEVPANIIRAMKEVERIAAIEEQALTPEQQDRLRFYLLQIARLAGENG
jgi:aspartate/methionine/tyrosine aminotransferase